MLLAIDPSSTCVGYAILRGIGPRDLVDAGRLRPNVPRLEPAPIEDPMRAWFRRPGLKAARRIRQLCSDLSLLLAEWRGQIDRAVIEVPSGLIGTGAKRGGRGSLTTYGMAAGALWQRLLLDEDAPQWVYLITEREWTRAAPSKWKRPAAAKALHENYAMEADDGADVADAILIGRWFGERFHGLA